MKKWITWVCLLLLLIAIAPWLGRPYYRQFKERRAVREAYGFLARGDHAQAAVSARAALAVNPRSATACRIMADLAEAARSPQSLTWRRRVLELEPTVSNQLVLAAALIRADPPQYDEAAKLLATVPESQRDITGYHLASAELALRQKRPEDAAPHFEAAIRLEPDNGVYRLNLAVLRLESSDAALAEKARKDLEGLRANPSWGGAAVRALVSDCVRRKDYAGAKKLSGELLNDPRAVFSDRIQHLEILHQGKDPALSDFLLQTQQRGAATAVQARELSTWMERNGRAAEALSWLQGLPAGLQPAGLMSVAIAESCAASKNWAALEAHLQGQEWESQEFMRLAFLSLAQRNQGGEQLAQGTWSNAVHQASERVELLSLLAQMARGWGWSTEAEELLWLLVEKRPGERWVLQMLHDSYEKARNTRGLQRVFSQLAQLEPTNDVVKNNLAMTSLLVKAGLPLARELAREIYLRNTNQIGYVSTYAFSLFQEGKPAEALSLMQSMPAEDLEKPAVAPYYGIVLSAVGRKEEARRYLALASQAALLPEEQVLVEQARKE